MPGCSPRRAHFPLSESARVGRWPLPSWEPGGQKERMEKRTDPHVQGSERCVTTPQNLGAPTRFCGGCVTHTSWESECCAAAYLHVRLRAIELTCPCGEGWVRFAKSSVNSALSTCRLASFRKIVRPILNSRLSKWNDPGTISER